MIFKEDNFMWIRLKNERFQVGSSRELQPRANGMFKVIKQVNDKAYIIDLFGNYNIFAMLNVIDLSPYYKDPNISSDKGEPPTRGEWHKSPKTGILHGLL